MKRTLRGTNRVSVMLLAIVVVACSISGLAAGVYARHLGDPLAAATTTAPPPAASHTPRAAASATSASSATATTSPRPAGNVEFALSAVAAPNALVAGQSVTITVTAVTRDGRKTPIAGLKCFMRAPSDGRTPLLDGWPPPQVTNTSGQAIWTLTAPPFTPGLYGIEVVAYGANGYLYYADAFITITG